MYKFLTWLSTKPGAGSFFHPPSLTNSAVSMYLDYLEEGKYSISSRDRAKAAISTFSNWLCRVSDVSWLKVDDCHIGPKIGWLEVGYKGRKRREIDDHIEPYT